MHSAVTCLRDIFGGGLIRCWATHNILKLLWVPRIYKTQDFPYIKTLYSSNITRLGPRGRSNSQVKG